MTDLQDIINFGLCISLFTLTAMSIAVASFLPGIERWNKIFFTSLVAPITLCMVSAIVDLMIYQDINLITLDRIAVYSQYLLLSVPMPIFTLYLLHTCGESWKSSRLFRVAIVIWIIFLFCWELRNLQLLSITLRRTENFIAGIFIFC